MDISAIFSSIGYFIILRIIFFQLFHPFTLVLWTPLSLKQTIYFLTLSSNLLIIKIYHIVVTSLCRK